MGKGWWKKSAAEISEARRQAWETRRKKYGPRGHAGIYERGPNAASYVVHDRMRLGRLVAALLGDGTLSEGQVARIIETDRLEIRRLRDDGIASLSYRPVSGEFGRHLMKRLES